MFFNIVIKLRINYLSYEVGSSLGNHVSVSTRTVAKQKNNMLLAYFEKIITHKHRIYKRERIN